MANTNADRVSGGSTAGGIFNLSDAALIALVVSMVNNATDTSPILVGGGTVTLTSDEIWGVVVT